MSLTPKQARFVHEYLVDHNGARAAIRAGYSPRRATVTGSELVANRNVAAAIAVRQAEIAQKLEVTQERIVEEYARLAFATARDAARWTADSLSLIASDDLDPRTAAAVKAVTVRRTITRGKDDYEQERSETRVEMHDKKGALDSLAKHLGMFIEQVAPQALHYTDARTLILGADLSEQERREIARRALG